MTSHRNSLQLQGYLYIQILVCLFFLKVHSFLITPDTGKHMTSCLVNGHNSFLSPAYGRGSEILFCHQPPWEIENYIILIMTL